MAAVEEMRERLTGARAEVERGSVPALIEHLMDQYEASGDANARYAMTAERFPMVADQMQFAREFHRAWLAELLAARLPRAGRERERVLSALHAATDVYTWKLLRRDLGLSRAETAATMTKLVEGVLPGDGD